MNTFFAFPVLNISNSAILSHYDRDHQSNLGVETLTESNLNSSSSGSSNGTSARGNENQKDDKKNRAVRFSTVQDQVSILCNPFIYVWKDTFSSSSNSNSAISSWFV